MCGTAKSCCGTNVSQLSVVELHPRTVFQGVVGHFTALQDRWTAPIAAQSRGLPSPCGRLDDDSPHAYPCKREAGFPCYSPPSLPQGLSVLPEEGWGYVPAAGSTGCPGPRHCLVYSHVVWVHSMGHISTDHVGLGHGLLEGCQVLRRSRDPAQHQLCQQGLRALRTL